MRYFRARPKKDSNMLVDQFLHRIELTPMDHCVIMPNAKNIIVNLPNEVFNWCADNFGMPFTGWAYGVRREKVTMYFKNKEEAMAFKLRWI